MTEQRREEIFAKEVLTTSELAEVYDTNESSASQLMNRIKRVVGDKLGVRGKILIEDYLKWVDTTHIERYCDEYKTETTEPPRRSVNIAGGTY